MEANDHAINKHSSGGGVRCIDRKTRPKPKQPRNVSVVANLSSATVSFVPPTSGPTPTVYYVVLQPSGSEGRGLRAAPRPTPFCSSLVAAPPPPASKLLVEGGGYMVIRARPRKTCQMTN